ncbi:MAG: hypothetical protein MI807_06815 [Verrucomicrobiales bacterium]|nr:hypothetical protein [Verrucomicrobiales bacterium]
MKASTCFRNFLTLLLFSACVVAHGQRVILQEGGGAVVIDGQKVDIIDGEGGEVAPGKVETGETDGKAAGEESLTAKPLNAQISQHILKLAEAEREKRLKFMAVVIDDVSRLCNLDEAQRAQMDLAAKGAAERSMKDWHTQAERYFRTRLDGADSDAAKEMLEGMGNVNFGGNRSEEEGESLELWKDTLKTVLSDDQVARYEEVLEQRELDRIEAFSKMSVSTLDSHLRLTPDQKIKMGELVQEAAADYLDDVQRYWGDYFERGMLMSLANAAEEEELRAILSEAQFDRLREATSNFDHFWDQKRRLRRAKLKAAKRRESKRREEDYKKNESTQ